MSDFPGVILKEAAERLSGVLSILLTITTGSFDSCHFLRSLLEELRIDDSDVTEAENVLLRLEGFEIFSRELDLLMLLSRLEPCELFTSEAVLLLSLRRLAGLSITEPCLRFSKVFTIRVTFSRIGLILFEMLII
jgi:hypothetical protein